MKEDFNPLPPHGGRRPPICNIFSDPVFQSTPSTRRETCRLLLSASTFAHFNPLPPHGGRPIEARVIAWLAKDFNPLPPHGGRLYYNSPLPSGEDISIHSLHTEGDRIPGSHLHNRCNFNPLPPHGGRPADELQQWGERVFQSTPSTRRETTPTATTPATRRHFNPLPPHGGRHRKRLTARESHYFNPLPPHGGRLVSLLGLESVNFISIHSLHTEGDDKVRGFVHKHKAFQSTPSTRRETQGKRFCA